ncbi:MAG: hypothetical protein D6727_09395, partial [Gammaproteobacteria bacterium]
MATITRRRRADGKLAYRVQDRTTGFPSLSETFPTLKAARDYKRKIEAERISAQAGIRRGRQTLAETIDDFKESADWRRRKSANDTARHLAWWSARIGQLPLAKITPDLIADHLHTLEAQGRTGATVNRYRSALSRVFRYAVNTRRWTDHNPCSMIERRPEGRRRERVITPDEWRRLLAAARELAKAEPKQRLSESERRYSPRAQLPNFLRVAYGTAARKSDVAWLRWEYVDLGEKVVTFPDPKSGHGYSVPLIDDALAAIQEQAELRRDGCPFVFPSRKGNDRPPAFEKPFAAARALAGLDQPDARGEVLTIHHLRHSAAT